MKRIDIPSTFAFVALLALVAGYAAADGGVTVDKSTVPGGFNGNLEYTGGPNVCGQCHLDIFDAWMTHGHSRSMALAFELGSGAAVVSVDVGDRGHTTHARSQGLPLARHDTGVYDWDNVMFIIGASKRWKSLAVDEDGYLLTVGGENQYNWETGEWVDYEAGVAMVPFDCGSCHTTGYQADGTYFNDQLGIPGIVGDFSHVNITCEACHGPGAEHADGPSEANIVTGDDITTEVCAGCHSQPDSPDTILASDGFIVQHQQATEYQNSPHVFFDFAFDGCATCHNGHVGRSEGFITTCESCHPAQAGQYNGSAMYEAGVKCIDCHMGYATLSANAGGPYEGDVRTHLFRIDSDVDYVMIEGGTANDALSLEYACFRCHADADKAAYAAIGDDDEAYHTLGK